MQFQGTSPAFKFFHILGVRYESESSSFLSSVRKVLQFRHRMGEYNPKMAPSKTAIYQNDHRISPSVFNSLSCLSLQAINQITIANRQIHLKNLNMTVESISICRVKVVSHFIKELSYSSLKANFCIEAWSLFIPDLNTDLNTKQIYSF